MLCIALKLVTFFFCIGIVLLMALTSDKDAVLPPVRMPSALLRAAREVARSRDESVAQVVRRALRDYVASAGLPVADVQIDDVAADEPET